MCEVYNTLFYQYTSNKCKNINLAEYQLEY
jgi:hypothetical protein